MTTTMTVTILLAWQTLAMVRANALITVVRRDVSRYVMAINA